MQVSLELTYLDENKNTIFEFDSNSIEDKKPIQLNLEKELDNKVAVPEMNTNGPYGYLAQMIVVDTKLVV